MDVKYFPGADTLLVAFSNRTIAQTQDLGENVLIELDEEGL